VKLADASAKPLMDSFLADGDAQGLKPTTISGCYGTTEVVPLQSGRRG
jgi:hypothetical protein